MAAFQALGFREHQAFLEMYWRLLIARVERLYPGDFCEYRASLGGPTAALFALYIDASKN